MNEEIKKNTPFAPFAYTDINLYPTKEEAEKMKPIPLTEQREVEYSDPKDNVFNNKHLSKEELIWQSFRYGLDVPPTKLKEVKFGLTKESKHKQ